MSPDEPASTSGADVTPDPLEESSHGTEPTLQDSDGHQAGKTESVQGQEDDKSPSEQLQESTPSLEGEEMRTSDRQDTQIEIQSHDNDDEAPTLSEEEDGDGDLSMVASPRSKNDAFNGSSSHRRIDSVPPQKYDVTQDAATGMSASLASTSLHSTIEEEESDISVPQYDDSADAQPGMQSASAIRSNFLPAQHGQPEALLTPTAIDKADLNFVDITLDTPADDTMLSGNLLEPPHPLEGSTRTAEQIRRDSVSSQNVSASSSATASRSQNSTAPASLVRSSIHELSPPHSPDQDQQGGNDSMTSNRSIEGRYRGRRSAASSRAASPTRSPSPSRSRRTSPARSQAPGSSVPAASAPSSNQLSITPAPALLAADEHGNISVVSDVPISPRTVPDALPEEEGGSRAAEGEHDKSTRADANGSSSDRSTAEVEATQPSLKGVSNGRTAASLSDEVQAADAAEASAPPASEKRDSAASSLAPPNGDQSTSSTSPGLSDKADQVDAKTRRKSSSAGADPVESRTRMTTLPAKTKTEEIKHRADFERMMMAAKEMERKKREEEEERKRRRQDEQREALGRWEKEILPSWSRARKDPELGELWWKGAPPSIRGRIWALAIGNPLMLPRNLLEQSEKKAAGSDNRPIEQSIPPRVLDQIDDDVDDTLPSLKLFQANGPLHDDLIRLCRAFVLVRMEQVAELDVAGDADKAASRHQQASPLTRTAELPPVAGSSEADASNTPRVSAEEEPEDEYARRGIDLYQPGLASLAAVLLINMSINTAFIALLNLLHSKPWLKALYSLLPTVVPANAAPTPRKLQLGSAARSAGTAFALAPKEKEIRGFERVLETLLADQMPKVYANLLARDVKLSRVVLRDWVSTLWSRWLDVDTVMRLWDVVLLDETDSMIYRVCLALVQTLESRLYVPDRDELESVLRGTNRAALAIWRRDKEMRGELEVHAQRSLAAPRHSRSSISSSTSAAPHSSSDKDSADNPAVPPPRSSSLAAPQSSPSSPPPDAELDFESILPRDYIYEQYALAEHHVFDTLEAQQAWWKQSTLQRLLDRELSE